MAGFAEHVQSDVPAETVGDARGFQFLRVVVPVEQSRYFVEESIEGADKRSWKSSAKEKQILVASLPRALCFSTLKTFRDRRFLQTPTGSPRLYNRSIRFQRRA